MVKEQYCKSGLFIYYSTRKWQHSFDMLKSFFLSDTHQSMAKSDSSLKVNRNIYPDAVTYDRMSVTI